MKYLVTGGAGYIGSHTVKQLCKQGKEVIVVDNLATGHKEAVDSRATFVKEDISNFEGMVKVFTTYEPDVVIHFAAYSIVGESMTNPSKYYSNNVEGTRILLDAMKECEIKKIVFSSTAATYGEPVNIPILESDPTTPTNAYGETKLAMEKMMHWFDIAHNIKYVALRYFNVGGAWHDGSIGERHDPETHLIPLILQAASGTRDSIAIYGDDYDTIDGTCIRDYIHVVDLADAHILAAEYLNDGNNSEVFNLGTKSGFSVKQMINIAKEVTMVDFKVVVDGRRDGDPSKLVASNEKAKKLLNWKPKKSNLEAIVADAWRFHKNN